MQNTLELSMELPSFPFAKLSAREHEILQLIVEGRTNPEIALRLHVSRNTVKSHVRAILNKLGVDGRLQAAVVAMKLGLIEA